MKIKMNDGSVYVENNKSWIKAIKIRLKENKKWLDKFVIAVDYHWKEKTTPTKFDTEDAWEKEYKNQAELAKDVAYPYLRAILMGMVFSDLTKGKGKVVALGKGGSATEYPSGKKSKILKK